MNLQIKMITAKINKMTLKPKNNNLPITRRIINMQNYLFMEKEKLNMTMKLLNYLLDQMKQ